MFKSLSFLKKNILLFIILGGVILISGAISTLSSYRIDHSIRSLEDDVNEISSFYTQLAMLSSDLKFDVVQVQQWLTDISATRGLDGLNDGFDVAKEFSEKFYTDLEATHALFKKNKGIDDEFSMQILSILEKMKVAFPPYYETGKIMAKAYVEEGPAGGNKLMSSFDGAAEQISNLTDEFTKITDEKLIEKQEALEAVFVKVDKQAVFSEIMVIVLACFTLVICLLGGLYLYKNLKELADSLAEGVGGVVTSVASSADQMNAVAQKVSTTMSGVTDKARGVSSASTEMSNNVNSVAASGEEMAATSEQISRQIEQSSIIVQTAVQEVRKAGETSQELDEASRNIGNLVKLIQDIAEQTNLLALNAAIESARAGDAGRGFAVVAEEVKKLSNQTASATSDIAEQIHLIQGVSKQVVVALKAIEGAIDGVEQNSIGIAGAVKEQTIATADISSSMTVAAESTNKITTDIANVESSAEEANQASSEVIEAAQTLSGESQKLAEQLSSFLKKLS